MNKTLEEIVNILCTSYTGCYNSTNQSTIHNFELDQPMQKADVLKNFK